MGGKSSKVKSTRFKTSYGMAGGKAYGEGGVRKKAPAGREGYYQTFAPSGRVVWKKRKGAQGMRRPGE